MRRLPLLTFLITLMVCGLTRVARADPPTLAGRWNATAMRSDWIIGEWGTACGPSPSGGGAAAGSVTITTAGKELHLSGAGRDYVTNQCWEQFPGLAPVSHSGGLRGWKNTCKTKIGDPRQATLVTTISATDNRISFDETGQYQFIITGQNCTASVRRTRSLSLVQREGESAPVATTPAAPAASATAAPTLPTKVCADPGPPARLEVRPARKLLRPGERFDFHTVVLDSAGCVLPLDPLWKVVSGHAALELSGPGKVHVAEGATESTVELQATLAGHAARVVIEIASQERYDALLAQNGLNAEGESSEAAVARIATSAIGGRSVVIRDDSRRRRIVFVGVVGGTALVLGLLGFVLMQHSRRKPLATEPRTAPRVRLAAAITPTNLQPLGRTCPTCREDYSPEATFCPNDGNRLLATQGHAEPAGPSGGVCPICGQGYDPGVLTCPKHGEELVPAALHASVRAPDASITKKICPMCGNQYGGDSQFCGGCGGALVPVN